MTLVFGRVLSFLSDASNHLISKILWRLTNAFTLLLIVAVAHQIGGELYDGYRKWSDASPKRVLNEALTKLQHEPADDVLRWYSKKTKIDLDVAGLDLSEEAMDMADTRINLAGLEILHLVADIEGEYQPHTLANIGFTYLRGEIVSRTRHELLNTYRRPISLDTPERLQYSLSCIIKVMVLPKTHKSHSRSFKQQSIRTVMMPY